MKPFKSLKIIFLFLSFVILLDCSGVVYEYPIITKGDTILTVNVTKYYRNALRSDVANYNLIINGKPNLIVIDHRNDQLFDSATDSVSWYNEQDNKISVSGKDSDDNIKINDKVFYFFNHPAIKTKHKKLNDAAKGKFNFIMEFTK